jgi:hypothetical protein
MADRPSSQTCAPVRCAESPPKAPAPCHAFLPSRAIDYHATLDSIFNALMANAEAVLLSGPIGVDKTPLGAATLNLEKGPVPGVD